MLDVFGLKQKPDPTTEADFYEIVSAIAQFIERVDAPEGDVINLAQSTQRASEA